MARLTAWFMTILKALHSFLQQPISNLSIHQPLRFTPEGNFQLAIFSDLHFGEGEIPC